MRLYRILCVMVFAVILASCNSSKKVLYMQDVAVDVPEEIANMHEIKVQPGDKITIVVSCMEPKLAQVFNLMESTMRVGQQTSNYNYLSAYSVDKDGDIMFPVLGRIHVAGLTRTEISRLIEKRLVGDDLLKDPYSDASVSKVGKISSLCAKALVIAILSSIAFNIFQLLFCGMLPIINMVVSIPVFSAALAFAVLLTAKYVRENQRLKRDNELFI